MQAKKGYGLFDSVNCPYTDRTYWCPEKPSWCVDAPEHCLESKNDLRAKLGSYYNTKTSKYHKKKLGVVYFSESPPKGPQWKTIGSVDGPRGKIILFGEKDSDLKLNVNEPIKPESHRKPEPESEEETESQEPESEEETEPVEPQEPETEEETEPQESQEPEQEIALLKGDGQIIEYIKFPPLDLPWKVFMSEIAKEFGPHLHSLDTSDTGNAGNAGDTGDACNSPLERGQGPKLTIPQQFARLYLQPSSPYKGACFWASVGTGKTILGYAIAAAFKGYYDLWWITSPALTKDMLNKKFDYKAFDSEGNPEILRSSKSPITLQSYQQLRNILQAENEIGRNVWKDSALAYKRNAKGKWRCSGEIDPLRKTLIIIDEAHKMFEEKDIDLIEQAINDSYRKSGPDSVRLVLMTATPVPGMETVQSEAAKEMAPFTALRLLNLLIPLKKDKLPLTETEFNHAFVTKMTKDTITFNKKEFRERTKGLASYYNHYEALGLEAPGTFAKPTFEAIKTITLADGKNRIYTKLASCNKTSPVKAKTAEKEAENKERRNLCYAKAAGWAGPRLYTPKHWRMESFDEMQVRAEMNAFAPKVVELANNIKHLDMRDKRQYNRKFKHIIFSSLNPAVGARVIAAVLRANGFDYINNVKHYINELGFNIAGGQVIMGDGAKSRKDSNTFMYFQEEFPQKTTKPMFETYNDHKYNAHGQLVRIALLDRKYKEGINMYDAKYLHIFEPQMTDTEFTQVVGRAIRRCGHSGLPRADRNVHIYVYDIKVNRNAIVTSKSGNGDMLELGDTIVYNRSSVKAETMRKIILDNLKLVAVDRHFIFGDSKKKKPVHHILGYLTDPVPPGRRIDATAFREKYLKIDHLAVERSDLRTRSTFKTNDDMKLDIYLIGFFKNADEKSLLQEILPATNWLFKKTKELVYGKPFKCNIGNSAELFADFNYHNEIVFDFPNRLFVPIFEWRERSHINSSPLPEPNDIRAFLVLHKDTGVLSIFIRNAEGSVENVHEFVLTRSEKMKNLAAWFKIPNLEFRPLLPQH